MAEPLIPDDVKALYEQLIDEGGRIVPADDPRWTEPAVRAALDSGFAAPTPRLPPAIHPVPPDVAFARVLARWQRTMYTAVEQRRAAERATIKTLCAFVRAAGMSTTRGPCSMVTGRHQVMILHKALTVSADVLVRNVSTGPYGETLFQPSGAPYEVGSLYFPPSSELRSSGGRALVLCDQEHVRTLSDNLAAGIADGEEARVVAQKLPMKLLIVDDHTALVPLGPYGHPCLLIRDRQLVATFAAFFDLFWEQGTPWPSTKAPTTPKESLTRQRILDALAAGLKDEAIARQLGVSVRTVRRHITALMHELGAANRFAAGVAAVRRGLVARAA
ncbi:MAG: LuxR C-terminal-related transcriptional regulator [Acidothermaceae bacterium]